MNELIVDSGPEGGRLGLVLGAGFALVLFAPAAVIVYVVVGVGVTVTGPVRVTFWTPGILTDVALVAA